MKIPYKIKKFFSKNINFISVLLIIPFLYYILIPIYHDYVPSNVEKYLTDIALVSLISVLLMFVNKSYKFRLATTVFLGFFYSGITLLIFNTIEKENILILNNIPITNFIIGLAIFPTAILTWITRQDNKEKERETNIKMQRLSDPNNAIIADVYHAIDNLVKEEKRSIKVISDAFIKTQEKQNLDQQIIDLLINSLKKDKFKDDSFELRQDILMQISNYYKRITKKELEKKIAELNKKIAELNKKIAELNKLKLNKEELDKLEQEVNNKKEELDKLEQEVNDKKEELDKLEQEVNDKHILYLERLDLKKANLKKTDLSGAKLEGAKLMGAELEGAKLMGSELEGASLLRANLEGADLSEAQLEGAKLMDAKLEGAKLMGSELEGASLLYANLKGAKLISAKLEGAYLWHANLKGADLRYANLEGADLWNANLKGAKLMDANLKGAKLMNANLRKASLRNAKLEGADLCNAKLEGADLCDANLEGADLSYANLEGEDLRNAKLEGASLRYAKLEGADLYDANLKGADLSYAKLEGANLSYANLEGAYLRNAKLEGASLRYAKLEGAKFFCEEDEIKSVKFKIIYNEATTFPKGSKLENSALIDEIKHRFFGEIKKADLIIYKNKDTVIKEDKKE